MTDLLSQLQNATEGSRELDAQIVAYLNNAMLKPYPPSTDFGPSDRWQFWSMDGKHFLGSESKYPVLPYTTVLDAKLPGEDIVHVYERSDGKWAAINRCGPEWADGLTEPLARRAAAIKAHESKADPITILEDELRSIAQEDLDNRP